MVILHGGNASGRVERLGDTVRKPWTPATPSVWAYLASLREAGVEVPAVHGRDASGRQVLEFVQGEIASERAPLDAAELGRVGSLVRQIHEASHAPRDGDVWEGIIPAPGADLICHNDLAPWNLVTGDRWVFIDWDGSAPSTRAWDLAYSAQTFTLNDAARKPSRAAEDLRAFVDGYGASSGEREALATLLPRRTEAMLSHLRAAHQAGWEPWTTMFVEGHGRHWAGVSSYVRRHASVWREALTG